jgi:basic amino acid/polyamine antiporter, APA family
VLRTKINVHSLLRKKPLSYQNYGLKKALNALDLTFFGIGAVIGAGIFILTGIVAATKAGPGVIFSFVLAGISCCCSALSYAELAASIGGSGSAYNYAYTGFGELIAWIIGWDLLLEYGISCPTVAIGWSGYMNNFLNAADVYLPSILVKGPFEGGDLNLLAAFLVCLITILLIIDVKQSAIFNRAIVYLKLAVILFFIIIAAKHFNIKNWQPFLPFGFYGVVQGASVIFFAYIGFDAISTAAEEARNPKRDLPIAILSSLFICTLIYIIVSGLLTGMLPYWKLNVSSPVAYALLYYHQKFSAGIIAIGAIAGLTTVCLVMSYGFTRIFLAMARDGLLPYWLAKLNTKTKTPVPIILLLGLLMVIVAAILPIHEAAELVNIGTLAAFTVVCLGVVVLRYTYPDLPRPFKLPFSPFIPILGAILSLALIFTLSKITLARYFIWMFIGLIIYFTYSRKHSLLAKQPR